MTLSGMWSAAAIAALSIGCTETMRAREGTRAAAFADPFDGAWHVDWCEAGQTTGCGGFTAYLVRQGEHVCGSHYGADAHQNRMDEGAPAAISGHVAGGVATVRIVSGRNHGVYEAQIAPMASGLAWTTEAQIRAGDNGEPAFLPDRDVLRPALDPDSLRILETVRAQCLGRG